MSMRCLRTTGGEARCYPMGRLAAHYDMRKDQLQEVSVMGKLWQRPKKCKAGQDERVVVFKQQPESEGYPTTS